MPNSARKLYFVCVDSGMTNYYSLQWYLILQMYNVQKQLNMRRDQKQYFAKWRHWNALFWPFENQCWAVSAIIACITKVPKLESHSIVLVDLNEFSSIFSKVQQPHSKLQKTTSNVLRITLMGRLRVSNEWLLEGALYIYVVKFLGHPPKCTLFLCCKFLKNIDGFRNSDKSIHMAFKIHKTL